VHETTEAILSLSQRSNGRVGGRGSAVGALIEPSVRAVGVVVLEVVLQDQREVAPSGDQEVVEAFAAQAADSALRDRVRSGCSNRAADDAEVRASASGMRTTCRAGQAETYSRAHLAEPEGLSRRFGPCGCRESCHGL
jgi:hypothetical protein